MNNDNSTLTTGETQVVEPEIKFLEPQVEHASHAEVIKIAVERMVIRAVDGLKTIFNSRAKIGHILDPHSGGMEAIQLKIDNARVALTALITSGILASPGMAFAEKGDLKKVAGAALGAVQKAGGGVVDTTKKAIEQSVKEMAMDLTKWTFETKNISITLAIWMVVVLAAMRSKERAKIMLISLPVIRAAVALMESSTEIDMGLWTSIGVPLALLGMAGANKDWWKRIPKEAGGSAILAYINKDELPETTEEDTEDEEGDDESEDEARAEDDGTENEAEEAPFVAEPCPACGESALGPKFCTACGADRPAPTPAPTATAQTPKQPDGKPSITKRARRV